MHRAIATAWGSEGHEYTRESEEFMLALDELRGKVGDGMRKAA
jgi:hypothetical protein